MNRLALLLVLSVTASLLGCGSSQRADPSLDTRDHRYAQAADAAYLAYKEGMLEQAARLYGTAMQRARTIDDRDAFVDAAYNRAYCLYLIGDYAAADRDLVEALAINAGGSKPAPAAGPLLLRGEIARALGDHVRAREIAEQATNSPGITDADRFRADVLRIHTMIDSGDLVSARFGFKHLKPDGPAQTLEYQSLRARFAEMDSEAEAAVAYDTEADLARSAARYRQMARAMADAGRMYEKADAPAVAADRYFAAARSYLGFGDRKTAAELATRAADAAARTESVDLKAAIADLVRELNAAP